MKHFHSCKLCKSIMNCNLRMCELFQPLCDICNTWLTILEELKSLENKLVNIK